jgi:1-pyrroline-5-carboxylate dehydrogenase
MNNAKFQYEKPINEKVLSYVPGSSERKKLLSEIDRMSSEIIDIPLIINGKEIRTKNTGNVVMPHDHKHILATYAKAGPEEISLAIKTALDAQKSWESISWVERLSITLRIAELISKKYRPILNAATMLGQGKNAYQAEIDAVCETSDFIRYNAHYVSNIYSEQPYSDPGTINRIEYRPLEGFIFSVTPFNFTAIASNLNLAPALMGNTLIWKPASTSLLSNYLLMQIFKEAGLPDGVINFLPGDGSDIGKQVVGSSHLAGIHFTGSTATFNSIWRNVSDKLDCYRSYPKIVGETGGKDFVFVHPSAGVDEVTTALVRGAFEYQGQKCSAASRAYIPESLWPKIKKRIGEMLSEIHMGDVRDFSNFVNAVIDQKAYTRIMNYISQAKSTNNAEIIFGGTGDDSKGYFIQPTVIQAFDPHFITMEEEIFGPVLSVFVYKDKDFEETLQICDKTSPYALTGSIFSNDRDAMLKACRILKYAAGNFYINDKPTGAVVGQQPFGGSRASGTNDKSGSYLNLLRWTNPRTIKETLIPPVDFKYPFMKEDHCDH